jgi:hypothetical protein
MDVGLFMERRETPAADGARFDCRDPISNALASEYCAGGNCKGCLSGRRQRSGGIGFLG